MRRLLLVALAMALLFSFPSCNKPQVVVIGSKNFTEQIILGELLAQQIEIRTGLQVKRLFNLGGTFICDKALRAGEIDGYVEYTGTALTAILHEQPGHDPEEVFKRVSRAYAAGGLQWLKPLGFNNTFAILVRRSDARRLKLKTISDAAPYAPGWRAGFGYEFTEREDGFKGLSRLYKLHFAGPPEVMELGLTYRALAEGRVDLIAGNSTSGLIEALDLFALRDDRNYFPPYDAAPVFRKAVLQKFPRLQAALEKLAGRISESRMRRMNFLVDTQKKSARQVVSEFLNQSRP